MLQRQDGGKADIMTDKEMHKISRRELLQLLLAQVRETEELKQQLAEREEQLSELRGDYEKLRTRLDQKDAKIHDLRDTLHAERTTRRIELQEAGSIAEAALRLNGIFDVAQKAADQYLENIRMLSDRLTSGESCHAPLEKEEIDEGEDGQEDMELMQINCATAPEEDDFDLPDNAEIDDFDLAEDEFRTDYRTEAETP